MDAVAAPVPSGSSVNNKLSSLLEKYPVILQVLRFGAIGAINTALDFLVLNFVSKTLGITSGLKLGEVNIVGFSLAVIQSYFWNRYWTFGGQSVGLWKNFWRLFTVALLGAAAMLAALSGAKLGAPASFYLVALILFVVLEVLVWEAFKLAKKRGCQIFDFEGIYDERFPKAGTAWKGFTKFKEGFGGEKVVFMENFTR